jgi:hypothetical protein
MTRVLILLMLAACGPTLTIYERTAPTRVDIAKQASPPVLHLRARRSGDGIELVAKHARDLRITRVVHYGAASIERLGGNPLVELLELPIGLLFLAVGPSQWETPVQYDDTATSKMVVNTNWLVAMINPFQTAIGYRLRATPTTDAQVFRDPPIVRELEMRLPVPNLAIRYRMLDAGARSLGDGTIATDAFGRAAIANAATAIAVEVTVDGKTVTIPVEPE